MIELDRADEVLAALATDYEDWAPDLGALDAFLTPWTGSALRHLSANAPYDVIDFAYAARSRENRWNVAGQPTLYLAGDAGVLAAEWGRHPIDDRSSQVAHRAAERTVYRLRLSLDAILDLRPPAIWSLLSLMDVPLCFTNRAVARAAAAAVREGSRAQAILVPSVAFLDDLSRWNLVVFLDKLPASPRSWIQRVETVGPLHWGEAGG